MISAPSLNGVGSDFFQSYTGKGRWLDVHAPRYALNASGSKALASKASIPPASATEDGCVTVDKLDIL